MPPPATPNLSLGGDALEQVMASVQHQVDLQDDDPDADHRLDADRFTICLPFPAEYMQQYVDAMDDFNERFNNYSGNIEDEVLVFSFEDMRNSDSDEEDD